MFIAPCHILYSGQSHDDIFRIDQVYPYDNDPYWSSDPRPRPLACVDSNEVCASDGRCWPMTESRPEQGAAFGFVRSALRRSKVYDSIKFRLGTALVAQDSVSQYVSRQLSDHQWWIEAEAMFATSLARIQYDALDIGTGAGHEWAKYKLDTPSGAKGRLCGLYKFKLPNGYTNINVVAYVGILLAVAFVCILSIPTRAAVHAEKREWMEGKYLVFECIIMQCIWVSRKLWRWTRNSVRTMSRMLKSCEKVMIQTNRDEQNPA